MFELYILGTPYQFNFGMGFLRTIDRMHKTRQQGIEVNIGLVVLMSRVLEGDIESLFTVLDVANKGFDPRLKQETFDKWIETEDTNIDEVFAVVESFFEKSNCTRKTYQRMTAND